MTYASSSHDHLWTGMACKLHPSLGTAPAKRVSAPTLRCIIPRWSFHTAQATAVSTWQTFKVAPSCWAVPLITLALILGLGVWSVHLSANREAQHMKDVALSGASATRCVVSIVQAGAIDTTPG
jgi:hypothetical protein